MKQLLPPHEARLPVLISWLLLFLCLLQLCPRPAQAQVYYAMSDASVAGGRDELRRSPLTSAAEVAIATGMVASPGPMAMDAARNRVLITDITFNQPKIVAVSLTSPFTVSTFITPAPISNSPSSYLTGIAVDAAGGFLYYAMSDASLGGGRDELRRSPLTTASETVLATGIAASPGDVALDAARNRVLVADITFNQPRIRAVSLTSPFAVSTFFTPAPINNSAVGSSLTGIAVDAASGLLYYAMTDESVAGGRDELRRSPLTTASETVLATGMAASPTALAVDAARNRVLVADETFNQAKIVAVSLTSPFAVSTYLTPAPISNSSSYLGGIAVLLAAAPTVTTGAAGNIAATSATLGGEVTADGGAAVMERGVVYLQGSGTPTTANTKVAIGSGTGIFAQSVTGLSANTQYSVRAYAINAVGTSYGAVQTFTTAAPATTVTSLIRASANPTNAASVNYTVTFAQPVMGLSVANFSLQTTGLSGASITSLSGSGSAYTVVVNTGTGDGTLRLNLANNAGLSPTVSNAPFTGEAYTLDRTAPTTSLTATPPVLTNSSAATFTFTGSDGTGSGVARFEGSLDGQAFVTATNPRTYTGLTEGSHTFGVRAVDNAGNTGPVASYAWTIDTTPPAAPVVSTPADGSTITSTMPAYSGTAEAGSTVRVLVDGLPTGTTTANAGGTWTLTQPTALSIGSHTVQARATDAAGNISPNSSTNTFTIGQLASYSGSAAEQASTLRVLPGSPNEAILRVAVTIGGGTVQPLSAQQLTFTTTGTTSTADIAAARLYYTGTTATFSTATAFGSAQINPNGSFSFTGSQQLSNGTNYFWLAYDVAANAASGNVLDATSPSLRISGTDYAPTTPSPAGNRRIVRTSPVAGQALRLTGDATTGYVILGTDAANPGPVLNGSYTQEVWFKPNINGSSSTFGVLGNGTGSSAAPYISITGDGRLEAGFGTGSALRSTNTNPNTLTSGIWHHVVATFNGSTLTLYLNGEVASSLNTTNTPASTPVNYIGALTTNGGFFPGDIDEVSQWNRALSAAEIRQMRHLVRTGVESGLVSYLQFNDSGPTTSDVNGAAGTLTGAGVTRASSTAPVGTGASSLQTITVNGAAAFAGTGTSINFSGVAGTSQVVVTRLGVAPLGPQPSGLSNYYVPAYWIINQYGTGTFATANVTYALGPNDISAADAASPTQLKLLRRPSNSDGAFEPAIGATSANATAGTLTFALPAFGQTVLGTLGTSPLPVELVSFTAERTGRHAQLRWATAQELNNAYFEVESSADGLVFQAIGRVSGHGNSSQTRQYQLLDHDVLRYGRPVVYYRLRQVDVDGTSYLSPVVTLGVGAEPSRSLTAELYPVPATDELTVRLSEAVTGPVRAQVYDAQGRLVHSFETAANGEPVTKLRGSVRNLPAGVYSLRLLLPSGVLHRPVIISR